MATPTPASSSAPARTTTPLLIACSAQFMVVLDATVVNVAIPSMRSSFHLSAPATQWIVNAYVIAFAGFLLLGGRLVDVFGRRIVTVVGIAAFTAASAACGLAPTGALLVVARGFQGLGAAILAPASLAIIVTTFSDGPHRRRAIASWSAVGASGGAAGLLVGGFLTHALSWRWIFLVNVPVGIVLLVATLRSLRDGAHTARAGSLDVVGAVTVTSSLTLLVYAIVSTEEHGWRSATVLAALLGSMVLLALFVAIEARWARHPLVPVALLKERATWSTNLMMLLIAVPFLATWYFLSLYLQGVQGYSALATGAAFVPSTLLVMGAAQVSGRLVSRIGPRVVLLFGAVTNVVGLVALSRLSESLHLFRDLIVPSVLAGIGVGFIFTPLAIVATAAVRPEASGFASGVLTTSRQFGGALGLAVLGTVAAAVTNHATAGGETAAASLVDGYRAGFLASAGFAVAAGAAALLIPRRVAAPTAVVVPPLD